MLTGGLTKIMSSLFATVEDELYMLIALGAEYAFVPDIVVTLAIDPVVFIRNSLDQQSGNAGVVTPLKFSLKVGIPTQAVRKLSTSDHWLTPAVVPQLDLTHVKYFEDGVRAVKLYVVSIMEVAEGVVVPVGGVFVIV